jgi:ACS family hexuronate transporter-like MFS transporter
MPQPPPPSSTPPPATPSRATRFRWVICGLLFSAITVNYVDRALFGQLAPELRKTFGWSSGEVADILLWFEVAYAVGLAFAGRILDRVGTRLGLAVSFAAWCLASMLHAGMATVLGFKIARFFLGITESGAYPGVTKATAEWFPRKERALVAGFYNAGSNVGSMIVPVVAPWLFFSYGWQWTFILVGSAGLVWLVFWLAYYRHPADQRRVSPAELAIIESDPPDAVTEMMPMSRILATRQAWSFIMGKFFTDMIFRWNINLLPLFFVDHFGLDIKKIGPPFFIIYFTAGLGSIGGGWLSSSLIHRGWSVNAARKTAMLVCVLGVLPVMLTSQVTNPWIAVLILSAMMAFHQGWSSNLYTSISDMFPKHAVGAVAGIGGTAGSIGAIALLYLTSDLFKAQKAAGANVDQVYTVIFVIAGLAYLAALACFHFLVPNLEPVRNLAKPAPLAAS